MSEREEGKPWYEQISPTVWASTIVLVAGSCFQYGYSYYDGHQFISMEGTSDWLYAIAILAIPILALGIPSTFLVGYFSNCISMMAASALVLDFFLVAGLFAGLRFQSIALGACLASVGAVVAWTM